METVSVTPYS